MKITIFSNFLNHHQKELCDELYRKFGKDFCFVATSCVPKERLSMGYHDMNRMRIPYLLTSYSNEENKHRAMNLALSSDIMVWGSAPTVYYLERAKYNKLTFVYSERIWKKGIYEIINIRKIGSYFYHHTRLKDKSIYLLCSSFFTASDFAKIGAYKNKSFKWGYFPTTRRYESVKQLQQNKIPKSILWVGRFIPFKHPEIAIEAAKILKSNGVNFSMKFIGSGELENDLSEMIQKYNIEREIILCASMTPEKVREEMEKSSIFIFTSDYGEGWGAVLNEAMNSACAVVTSNAAGATGFLVKNGYNGLVYNYKSSNELACCLENLLRNEDILSYYGGNAYKTIIEEWNASIAAIRLVSLSKALLEEQISANSLYSDGPCSPS